MRSTPFKRSIADRLEDMRASHLYACSCPRRPIARVDDITGGRPRLLRGTADCSRHRCGRAMRLYWRMKSRARAGLTA